MNVDRAVFAMAGSMVLISIALAWLFSPYWLLLAAFVGANMLQAAFTGFCPAAIDFPQAGIEDRLCVRRPARRALSQTKNPGRSAGVFLIWRDAMPRTAIRRICRADSRGCRPAA